MDETLIAEIENIRTRLSEITDEREHLPDTADSRREELLEEEHRLESRLTTLEDEAAEEESGVAEEKASRQTDLTHAPKLPQDPEGQ
jgi:predicted  nucleic acid-binding Zn-ribbon protein